MENQSNFIALTPHLFECCMKYIDSRKLLEQTKMLYTKELESIFKEVTLTPQLYNKIYNKGNYHKSVLRLIIDTCIFFDIPYYNYKTIRQKVSPRKNPQVWNENDIIKMMENINTYGLLIASAYYIGGGLRFSSAIFLKWDDFNWGDWILNKDKSGICFVTAKGGKERNLPVHPILMNKLYNLARERNRLFRGIPYLNFSGNPYIFIDISELEELEDNIEKEKLNHIIDKSNKYLVNVNKKEKAKIELIKIYHNKVNYELNKLSPLFNSKIIKFHSIRSSRATNLLKKGFSLLEIKDLLMHNSIATTQIYLNIDNKDLQDKFDKSL